MLETPVLFLIFNRLDTASKVFASIKNIKPKRLFIAADGWRIDKIGEKEKCEETRKAILTQIDWSCEVETLFRDKNLGCRQAVSSAIDWFFSKVEEGIILEDDCLPHRDFFRFCEDLLKYYREDERIMLISGDNFQFGQKRGEASYYFSRFTNIWGWASWRRAWKNYDVDLKTWPEFKKQKQLKNILSSPIQYYFWQTIFNNIYYKNHDTWDHQVTYVAFSQNQFCIIPNVNLISNIGTDNGTHTSNRKSLLANLPTKKMRGLIHPIFMLADKNADNFIFWKAFLNWRAIFKKFKFW